MDKKALLKKIWLPVVTALVISAGALVLSVTIESSQAAQSSQTVSLTRSSDAALPAGGIEQLSADAAEEPVSAGTPTPTSAPASVASAAIESVAEEPAAEPTPMPTAASASAVSGTVIKPLAFSAYDGDEYSYSEVANPEGSMPGASDLGFEEAGRIAVSMFSTAFGDGFTNGSTDIYVQYQAYSGLVGGWYDVLVGSSNWDEALYFCCLDSSSAQIRRAEKLTPANQQTKNDTLEDSDNAMMDSAYNDPKYQEIASQLINENFACGRTISEIMIDGIQWDFNDPDVDVLVDCKVRMSEGECYLVRIGYPTYEINSVDVYPLGWHSCLWGYYDEAEAADYPSLEEMGME